MSREAGVNRLAAAVGILLVVPCCGAQEISTGSLGFRVDASAGSYSLLLPRRKPGAVVTARTAARINGAWVHSSDYRRRRVVEGSFRDELGPGREMRVICDGLDQRPDLVYVLQLYDNQPYGTVQMELQNRTGNEVRVQALRSAEATGTPLIDLGGPESAGRILSDSFSEDLPRLVIYDLAQAPGGVHRGAGSQLIYNRESRNSLFFGALTAARFLTLVHLGYRGQGDGATISSLTVDSTGTTEIQREIAPEAQIELSVPLPPGGKLVSERIMVAAGADYHGQLLAYGDAIRRLHRARVRADNLIGWWSWTSYYMLVNEGVALTNMRWMADHMRSAGYQYFHLDEGYQYARGEYTTPNATQFPDGIRRIGDEVRRLGLTFGIWTGPFEVSDRAEIYETHKDWLVHRADGTPICIGTVPGQDDRLYVLDTTHPAAQEYLRKTYQTLTREWGARYIKLDFMDVTSIEGYRYRPNTTALEALRIGLEVIRKAVGDEVLLDKDGSPMLTPVGLVDAGRISFDTRHSFVRTRGVAPGIAARFYMNRNFYINDPDAYNLCATGPVPPTGERQALIPVSLAEAQASMALSAVSGGMFEIGDDLPQLAHDRERLALAMNRDLLNMAKLGRSSIPIDLLSYSAEDEQPSIFVLREEPRQSIVTVFNWTDRSRSRTLRLQDFGLRHLTHLTAYDVLNGGGKVPLDGAELRIREQAPHSVRVIKFIDEAVPAAGPSLKVEVPSEVKLTSVFHLSAEADTEGPAAVGYNWDFGDGVTQRGRAVSHAYTETGEYAIKLTADGLEGLSTVRTFRVTVTGKLGREADLKLNRRYTERNTR